MELRNGAKMEYWVSKEDDGLILISGWIKKCFPCSKECFIFYATMG
jgi:hypothetical protein